MFRSMIPTLKRLLWLNRVRAITHLDVQPAPRDEMKEKQVRAAQVKLVQELMGVERASWRVRQELAGQALKIVSGD